MRFQCDRKCLALVFLCLVAWSPLLGGSSQPKTTFPHIVAGGPVVMEILLTNSTNQTETGAVNLFNDAGEPLSLEIEGVENSRFEFNLPPGGSLHWTTSAGGPLRSGYATITTAAGSSELSGSIIFRLGGSEVSIPNIQPVTAQHSFAEFNATEDTGAAFANLNDAPIELQLSLLDESGNLKGSRALSLEAGQKQAVFISQLFEGLEPGFEGTLHARSDQSFAMLGLRQKDDGTLATLAGAPTAFQTAVSGSELIFALDAGIDLTTGEFTDQQLQEMSVFELTGDRAARQSSRIRLSNPRSVEAVTVHLRLLNDQCTDVLDYVVVIPCQQEFVFDPFDLLIPGTVYNTSDRIFGGSETPVGSVPLIPISGATFGTGRFLLVATTVGVPLDEDNLADLRFPNEISPVGTCDITPLNTGSQAGLRPLNLTVCSAQPMSFDYLRGVQLDGSDDGCSGPDVLADAELLQASAFTRELTESETILNCHVLSKPASCGLLEAVESLGRANCGSGTAGATVAVPFGGELFTIVP